MRRRPPESPAETVRGFGSATEASGRKLLMCLLSAQRASTLRVYDRMPQLRFQILELFLLAIPVACVAWTVTHEEVFREPREYCKRRSESCRRWYQRKFFYLFTCEYCFSHYIAVIFVALAQYKLLFADWRGYLISWFAVVWV